MKDNDLPDVQNSQPKINVDINRVGISDLILPVFVSKKDNSVQHTIANISCFVNLDKNLKGINMSRIPIAIHKFIGFPLTGKLIQIIANSIKTKSEANMCQLIYKFPYFLQKLSPISKESGQVLYNVTFDVSTDRNIINLSVQTTTTSLCPCSKEISSGGAHNQKCFINITCETGIENWIWIEDLIKIAEDSSSCEIFSVLKRSDEKFVTEKAYKNPYFVEDIARNCYEKLDHISKKTGKIGRFIVEVISDESIHNHKAFAEITGGKNYEF